MKRADDGRVQGPGTIPIAASGLVWINVGRSEPAVGRNLAHAGLALALQRKTEFIQQEWEEFGIWGLHTDHYIKSGDSYFQPANEDPAYPVNPAHLPPRTRLSLGVCCCLSVSVAGGSGKN